MAFNVLIVDDSASMRRVLRRTLDVCGIESGKCLEAGNGMEALGVLRREWIDIILTDINMPVMNGEEMVRRLHEDEMLRSIPVLVVSSDRSKERLDHLCALGARGYLTKPFLPEALGEEIKRVLLGGDRDEQ